MGIYDTSLPLKPIIIGILLIISIILSLPPSYYLQTHLSKSPLSPGEEGILWIRVKNNGPTPLSGVSISLDSDLYLDKNMVFLPDIAPYGEISVDVKVRGEEPPGDHLVRVFFSTPGRTEVVYVGVRVG